MCNRRWLVVGLLLVGGCAVLPKELVNARSAYRAMESGSAGAIDATQAQRAHDALARAEDSYRDHGATAQTRELARTAEREAVAAEIACFRNGGTTAVAVVEATPQQRLQEVLTAVPGTVMFEFDKADLLPAAKTRLDELARALADVKQTDQAPQSITIAGYSDGQGDAAYNLDLSRRRANAVRDYLAAHGADPSFVEVKAYGEQHPFTTNSTVEGRANNRRVEIFLAPKKNEE